MPPSPLPSPSWGRGNVELVAGKKPPRPMGTPQEGNPEKKSPKLGLSLFFRCCVEFSFAKLNENVIVWVYLQTMSAWCVVISENDTRQCF